ncbi:MULTISPECIES: DUF58 domain-containing protein [Exiguobacterium]|uniref:DUF58 domain-containing protein n=1 Tax=Exiguobacterium TaxID=33986 RepID=UPI0006AA1602|nr:MULTISPECIES: DUF58 domain-containing protein [Exiguobacterium]KOP30886.1 hypothetical protein ADM98_05435 [Exiguobacterium sp. BMC-KP]UKS56525.1 DUF58 domain-containing protein [Exiguobacterium acetylicum]
MTKWQIGWRYAVLLLTTAALWTYARVDGGNVASLLFYVMAGLTVYWTLFLIWPVTQALATREVSNKMLVAGTDIPVSLHVRRRFPFLVGAVEVTEAIPNELSEEKLDISRPLRAHYRKTEQIDYTIPSIRRGVYQIPGCIVEITDPFGLFKRKRMFPVETYLAIEPARLAVQLPHEEDRGDGGISPVSIDLRQSSFTVVGVREYVSGDRMNQIDWKATAKRQGLMTKTFEREQERETTIVFDEGTEAGEAFERVISMLAEATDQLNKRRLSYRIHLVGHAVQSLSLPLEGAKLTHYLMTAQPSRTRTFIESWEYSSKALRLSGNVLFITPDLESNNELWISKINQEATVHVYTPERRGVR